tara:strand:- start:34 stop:1176 length:1143 start_codon:yes stop_codon:yes gene_type:complete
MQSEKIFDTWTHNKFISNPKYNFSRDEILKVLPKTYIDDAYAVISSWEGYKPTPLIDLNKLTKNYNLNKIFYKDESRRFKLKSFKALGGAYAVEKISAGNKNITVSTATAGNHGKSVAWGAQRLGLKSKIFISENVSESRAKDIASFGAEIIKVKGNYDDSLKACINQSKKNNWEIIQDVAWQDYELVPKLTMSGYSVMIKEISEQTNHYITHIFLQAGVGGMASAVIAGVARYFKRIPKIIIIEPQSADCVLASILNSKLTKVDIKKESIMGGMSCGEVSLVPWQILKNSVNNCLSMSDDNIASTVTMLAKGEFSDDKIIGGECSAPGIMSLIMCCNNKKIKQSLGLNEKSNILLIGCEGDTDTLLYNRMISLGNEKLK